MKEVRQVYYEVAERDRTGLLFDLLRDSKAVSQALVFRRTKIGVDKLERSLQRSGFDAQAIHGDMTQAQRNAVMKRFRAKTLRILVATNVASRGLDIPAVSHVRQLRHAGHTWRSTCTVSAAPRAWGGRGQLCYSFPSGTSLPWT